MTHMPGQSSLPNLPNSQFDELWDLQRDLEKVNSKQGSYYLKVEDEGEVQRIKVVQGGLRVFFASIANFFGARAYDTARIEQVVLHKLQQATEPTDNLILVKGCQKISNVFFRSINSPLCKNDKATIPEYDSFVRDLSSKILHLQQKEPVIEPVKVDKPQKKQRTFSAVSQSMPEQRIQQIAVPRMQRGATEKFLEANRALFSFCLGDEGMEELQGISGEINRAGAIEEKLLERLCHFAGMKKSNSGEMAKLLSVGASWMSWKYSPFVKENTEEKKRYDAARDKLDHGFDILGKSKSITERLAVCKEVANSLVEVESLLYDYKIPDARKFVPPPLKPIPEEIEAMPERVSMPQVTSKAMEELFDQTIEVCKNTQFAAKNGIDLKVVDEVPTLEGGINRLITDFASKNKQANIFERDYINVIYKAHKDTDTILGKLWTFLGNSIARHEAREPYDSNKKSPMVRLESIQNFVQLYEELSYLLLAVSPREGAEVEKIAQAKRAVLLIELRHLAELTVKQSAEMNSWLERLAGNPCSVKSPLPAERLSSITMKELQVLYNDLKKLQSEPTAYNDEWDRHFAEADKFEKKILLEKLNPDREVFSLIKDAAIVIKAKALGVEAQVLLQANGVGSPSDADRAQAKQARLLIVLRQLTDCAPNEVKPKLQELIFGSSTQREFSVERLGSITKQEVELLCKNCIQVSQQIVWPQFHSFQQEIELLVNDLE